MAPHVRELSRTWSVTVVASEDPELRDLRDQPVAFARVAIPRRISVLADLKALIALWKLFRHHRFDVIQSITPKAGLLAMVAGRLAGAPVRIHWFTGQVWATTSGARRWLLRTLDRILVASSTHLLADSSSQREFLIREGVGARNGVHVLGHGSVAGVDVTRFRRDEATAARVRARLDIPMEAIVALYLGRLHHEKGLPELAAAFVRAAQPCPHLHLLLVGPDEGMRPALERTMAEELHRVRFVEYTSVPEEYMAAADLFLIPSHREGFGSSVIEAAACGVPSIGTRIYGLTDAIVDGETGLLVPVGNVEALADAIVRLTRDQCLRQVMGARARRRVEADFAQAQLVAALSAFYERVYASSAGR